MLDALLKVVSLLIDRLARSKTGPHVRRRDLCHKLRDLHVALRTIIDTGNAISQLSSFNTIELRATRVKVELLTELLHKQNGNIRTVSKHAKLLESVLRIKMPAIAESLAFYIPRKGNVITILVSQADEAEYQQIDPVRKIPS